jgi:dihydroorotase
LLLFLRYYDAIVLVTDSAVIELQLSSLLQLTALRIILEKVTTVHFVEILLVFSQTLMCITVFTGTLNRSDSELAESNTHPHMLFHKHPF